METVHYNYSKNRKLQTPFLQLNYDIMKDYNYQKAPGKCLAMAREKESMQ